MTRKQYINKVQWMILAFSKSNMRFPGWKMGEALKNAKRKAKDVPKVFGSYEAAWNSDVMEEVRKLLGLN